MKKRSIVFGVVAFISGVIASPFVAPVVSARRSAPQMYTVKVQNFNPASAKDVQDVSNMLNDMDRQGWTYVDREASVFVFRK